LRIFQGFKIFWGDIGRAFLGKEKGGLNVGESEISLGRLLFFFGRRLFLFKGFKIGDFSRGGERDLFRKKFFSFLREGFLGRNQFIIKRGVFWGAFADTGVIYYSIR